MFPVAEGMFAMEDEFIYRAGSKNALLLKSHQIDLKNTSRSKDKQLSAIVKRRDSNLFQVKIEFSNQFLVIIIQPQASTVVVRSKTPPKQG